MSSVYKKPSCDDLFGTASFGGGGLSWLDTNGDGDGWDELSGGANIVAATAATAAAGSAGRVPPQVTGGLAVASGAAWTVSAVADWMDR